MSKIIDTKEVKKFRRELERSIIPKLRSMSKSVVTKFVIDAHTDIQRNTPVDKGALRAAWQLDFKQTSDSYQGEINNSLPYAVPIEVGSTPGKRPWKSPGPKTVLSEGKIYSSQAVGGVVNKVVDDKSIDKFMTTLADIVDKVIK